MSSLACFIGVFQDSHVHVDVYRRLVLAQYNNSDGFSGISLHKNLFLFRVDFSGVSYARVASSYGLLQHGRVSTKIKTLQLLLLSFSYALSLKRVLDALHLICIYFSHFTFPVML